MTIDDLPSLPIFVDSPLGLAVLQLRWDAELRELPRIVRVAEVPVGGVVTVEGAKWPDGKTRLLVHPTFQLDPGDEAAFCYVDGEQS